MDEQNVCPNTTALNYNLCYLIKMPKMFSPKHLQQMKMGKLMSLKPEISKLLEKKIGSALQDTGIGRKLLNSLPMN